MIQYTLERKVPDVIAARIQPAQQVLHLHRGHRQHALRVGELVAAAQHPAATVHHTTAVQRRGHEAQRGEGVWTEVQVVGGGQRTHVLQYLNCSGALDQEEEAELGHM